MRTLSTEYNSGMNERIANFEFLWITTVLPPPMPPLRREPRRLMRQKHEPFYELFPPQLKERWQAASDDEREEIENEFQELIDMPTELRRATNDHEVLPPELRAEWDQAAAEEKEEIVKNYQYWRDIVYWS